MNTEPTDTHADNIPPATPRSTAITLLAYGARGQWEDTANIIAALHATNADALARAFAAFYQMIRYQNGPWAMSATPQRAHARIARSLSLIGREEYAAVRVADKLLSCLAADDIAGFADEWDGVRFAFSGRNVIPVAAAVLMIALVALEPEDNDADVLLDRLTADGSFTQILKDFGYGDDAVSLSDCD